MKTSLADAFASGVLARVNGFHPSPCNNNALEPSLSDHSALVSRDTTEEAAKQQRLTNEKAASSDVPCQTKTVIRVARYDDSNEHPHANARSDAVSRTPELRRSALLY